MKIFGHSFWWIHCVEQIKMPKRLKDKWSIFLNAWETVSYNRWQLLPTTSSKIRKIIKLMANDIFYKYLWIYFCYIWDKGLILVEEWECRNSNWLGMKIVRYFPTIAGIQLALWVKKTRLTIQQILDLWYFYEAQLKMI